MDLKKAVAPQNKLSDSLLQVNQLSYRLPPEIGVARAKKVVVDQFQRTSYSSGRMILDAQTGSAFVNGRESWIEFNLSCDQTVGLGQGSALNVIEEALVKGRGGREVSRVERCNLLGKNVQTWKASRDYINSVGGVQGYAPIDGFGDIEAPGSPYVASGLEVTSTARRFCIPLSAIAPVFDQARLLPPQLMEGMRIELLLASLNTAFVRIGTAPTTYTVANPEIHWSTVDLADQFKRKINEMAASRGLNLLHKEYFHQISANNTGQFNFDVRKAASKALKMLVVSRADTLYDVNTTLVDSMGSESFLYSRAISHIGADYFPQQAITADSKTDYASFYQNTLHAMDKMGAYDMPPSVGYTDYGRESATIGGKALYAVRLNKSGVSDLDGYQINNSRALIADVTFSGSAVARTLDIWLQHLRAVKVFTSGLDVKD